MMQAITRASSTLSSARASQASNRMSGCDRALRAVVKLGGVAGVSSTIIAGAIYQSNWMSILIALPTIGCGIAHYYIRQYQKLKPINQISNAINRNTDALTLTASAVNQLAHQDVEIQIQRHEAEETMERELSRLRSACRESTEQIEQMNQTVSSLTTMNQEMREEKNQLLQKIAELQRELFAFSSEIDRFKNQNLTFCNNLNLIGIQIDQFGKEEKEMQQISSHLESNVSHVADVLGNTQRVILKVFQELKEQNHLLQKEIAELSSLTTRFEEVDRKLTPKLIEKRKLKKELDHRMKELGLSPRDLTTLNSSKDQTIHQPKTPPPLANQRLFRRLISEENGRKRSPKNSSSPRFRFQEKKTSSHNTSNHLLSERAVRAMNALKESPKTSPQSNANFQTTTKKSESKDDSDD